MADSKQEIEARKQANDLRREEQRLLERKLNLELQLNQEGDKRLKSARDIKDEIERTNILINRNSDQQITKEKEINRLKDERIKSAEVIENLERKISRHTKDTRDLSSKLNKILTSSKGVVFEQFSISSKTVVQRKTENEQLLKILKNKESLGKMDSKEIENLEQIVVGNNALNDIERELIEDVMANSATEMDREEVLNALKDKGLNIDKLSAEAKENILNHYHYKQELFHLPFEEYY